MHPLLRIGVAILLVFATNCSACAATATVMVVSAENFYGNIAKQIAGGHAKVISIVSNPDQDPHLFETAPSVARNFAKAQIVIINGADYDPWADNLIKAAPRKGRTVISVASLVGKGAGDNPHLWYDPPTAPAVARAIAAALSTADPAHKADYAADLNAFLASLNPLNEKIAQIRSKFAGAPVTASEPVFGYMASALRLKMRNQSFQRAIMNDTEPSARDIAAFEQDLKERRVRLLFYNKQAAIPIVLRLVKIAKASGIPVVGITETTPPGLSFQDWLLSELDSTEKALAGAHP